MDTIRPTMNEETVCRVLGINRTILMRFVEKDILKADRVAHLIRFTHEDVVDFIQEHQ